MGQHSMTPLLILIGVTGLGIVFLIWYHWKRHK